MYPYYYPSYFSPGQMGAPMGQMGPGMPGMGGPGVGDADTGIDTGFGTGGLGPSPVSPGTTSGPPSGPVSPPPSTIETPIMSGEGQPPPVTTDIGYTQAFLKTQIGKKARVEFLIGTNMLTDRTGVIVDVGISYILLKLVGTDDIMLGDIYSIKFVTFLQ